MKMAPTMIRCRTSGFRLQVRAFDVAELNIGVEMPESPVLGAWPAIRQAHSVFQKKVVVLVWACVVKNLTLGDSI